jgi:hypothetical protein
MLADIVKKFILLQVCSDIVFGRKVTKESSESRYVR